MIDKTKNTSVYCKFSKTVYKYMESYSNFVGSSISDFIRQAVVERIIRLGEIDFKEYKENENI